MTRGHGRGVWTYGIEFKLRHRCFEGSRRDGEELHLALLVEVLEVVVPQNALDAREHVAEEFWINCGVVCLHASKCCLYLLQVFWREQALDPLLRLQLLVVFIVPLRFA